ncbi:hypothetical protein KGF56_002314 [Candida oxycetoniae]|uniref:Uncharacterized protein n=1 Tax=Candida oxycetoniae TaxID=497107 RepID=A0AAI9SXG6_9ASCO|nr:uncharacterized protein KGF56_002314 [Candida oxycetoniae]KAI3404898.2 hypothetical protein KGF56_002314 [Candida oxycetoniae]
MFRKFARFSSTKSFSVESVVLFSTPNNLAQVIQDSIALHRESDLQVVVAGIDTVLHSRNGVSELWLDHKVKIHSSVLLEEANTRNWRNISGSIGLNLRHEMNMKMSVANTIFSTGSSVTLFYLDSNGGPSGSGPAHSGEHLSSLVVDLPRGVVPSHAKATVLDNWVPLFPRSFKITSCIGNLLKTVEKAPAAQYLEESEKLMALKSKETQVFVRICNTGERFKVVAGGGGWGAKAGILALSPEAAPKVGDEIEFYMVPENNHSEQKQQEQHHRHRHHHHMIFTSSYEEKSYSPASTSEQVLENKKYPMAFKQYNEHCNSHTDLLGTALLVEESGTSIACLFTSDFTQTPHQIVKHTENALRDLFNQVGHCKVNIPKINSGIFNVPWELTEAVLINSELEFNVYIW